MTTAATAQTGGATPPRDANSQYATYVPHDLKYNSQFEDDLVQAILHSNGKHEGIRIIPDDSDEQAVEGVSARLSDIAPHTLPTITEDELPLPLNDPRRIFASSVPGVKLTHAGGYLEGGPGLDPQLDTFADDFLSSHPDVTTSAQLQRALQKETETSVELLRERLRARAKAKERNEQIEKELKVLTDQHSMELRIHNRMQEEVAKKKEAKEKRKREKEGG